MCQYRGIYPLFIPFPGIELVSQGHGCHNLSGSKESLGDVEGQDIEGFFAVPPWPMSWPTFPWSPKDSYTDAPCQTYSEWGRFRLLGIPIGTYPANRKNCEKAIPYATF